MNQVILEWFNHRKKIGEVWLYSKIDRGGGFEILKKLNFTITIRYEIPTFSSVWPFSEYGGGV